MSLTAATSLVARGFALATALLTVPITLTYLGAERYGMWMTITSALALLSFADLGVGNGLLNSVAQSVGTGDREGAIRKISSALIMLITVATVLGGAFAASYALIPWPRLFGVTSALARSEAGPAVAIWVACFLIGLPLSVAAQVRIGLQEGYVVHVVSAFASVASIAFILLAIASQQGLPVLVLSVSGVPLLAGASTWCLVFLRAHPYLKPSWRNADRRSALSLAQVGVLFFVLQLSMAVAFTSDAIVIAQVVGPVAVAEYSVTAKLFMIPTVILNTALAALWPAYREALSRGDLPWAKRTLRRSIQIGLAITVPSSLFLVGTGLWLIHFWVGNSIRPSFVLVVGFGAWIILNGFGTAVAMFLNGAEEIVGQAAAAIVMAVTNITLSIWLTMRIGVAGAIWGTVITYFLFSLIPMTFYVPRVLRRIEQHWRTDANPAHHTE